MVIKVISQIFHDHDGLCNDERKQQMFSIEDISTLHV